MIRDGRCVCATCGVAALSAAMTADQREEDDRCRRIVLYACVTRCLPSPMVYVFRTSNHRKNGPPMSAVITPTGSSTGAMTVRASDVAGHQERRAEQRRRRKHDPVIGADHQAHQVRHDDADEADRAADRYRGAGCQRRAEEGGALRARRPRRRASPRCRRRGSAGSAAAPASAKTANATITSGSARGAAGSC